jgi:hypothetical protein
VRYRNGFREHGGIAAVLSMMCETESAEVMALACWVLKNVACSGVRLCLLPTDSGGV